MSSDRIETYKRDLAFAAQADERRRRSKLIARSEDLVWSDSARHSGKSVSLVHPEKEFDVNTMMSFITEIPPGAETADHRHYTEAIIYILSGKGYSIIEGNKYEWKEGDIIAVPTFVWHKHANTDPDRPARFLAVSNNPLMKSLAMYRMESSKEELRRLKERGAL